MKEEITVTIQAVYQCPAEASLTAQTDMIHHDLIRLLDTDSTTDVAMCGVTIQHAQSEAMSYGNTPPRNIPAHQTDQMDKLHRHKIYAAVPQVGFEPIVLKNSKI